MKNQYKIVPMTKDHLPLWLKWIEVPYVKDVWFIEGYEPPEYIHQKIAGNGYDYPFILYLNDTPIGYIVCCDLDAYYKICPDPKTVFDDIKPGTFCFDIFIGEEQYLDQGHGTQIVKAFINKLLTQFNAKVILIDPAESNKRAIRCYEKVGFKFLKRAHDGIADCYVMVIKKDATDLQHPD